MVNNDKQILPFTSNIFLKNLWEGGFRIFIKIPIRFTNYSIEFKLRNKLLIFNFSLKTDFYLSFKNAISCCSVARPTFYYRVRLLGHSRVYIYIYVSSFSCPPSVTGDCATRETIRTKHPLFNVQ